MQMTGSEAIVRCLERAGVEYVFGLCGHANLSMLDALADSKIHFIGVRNEQNAAHMAAAYFRFSHKPGVVLATIGPGMANAVPGVWEAALDCSGVVVICGNVPSYMIGRDAFQELSVHADGAQWEVYRPFVKRAWRVPDAAVIPHVMQRAFNFATAGVPGPVLVDVPTNYFSEVRTFDIPDMARHRPTGTRIRGDAEQIAAAVQLLLSAKRPLIHAGYGTMLSDASADLVALAEHLGIPVTTSLSALGVIDRLHPLCGAYPGIVGTPTGNRLANEADVVLALGTRFSELETSSWDPDYSFRIGDGCVLIQVDIDPHEIGKAYPVQVGIVGDVKAVLQEMLGLACALTPQRPWEQREQVRELHRIAAEWQEEKDKIQTSDEKPIRLERVLYEMTRVLPEETIIVADVGTFRHGIGHYYPIRRPQSWYLPSGLGTMGAAASAALGAKLAQPDRPVVAVIGDGGFSIADHALATAVEAGLPVIWIVLNNFAYDSIRVYQHIHYDDRVYGTEFRDGTGAAWNPDFVKIAEGYGVGGVRVEEPEQLQLALQQALAANRPYVLEVVVAPTRLKATGHWEFAEILRREGQFKRNRRSQKLSQAAD